MTDADRVASPGGGEQPSSTPRSGSAKRRAGAWVLGGIGLVLVHLAIVFSVNTNASQHLCYWDCEWYASIAAVGYRGGLLAGQSPAELDADLAEARITERMRGIVLRTGTTAGFFPAYPLLGRVVALASGLPEAKALPATSWLCAMVMWAYWLALTARWSAAGGNTIVPTMVLLAYPGSFYLVAGYAEALFVASMLGIVYWTELAVERRGRNLACWALVAAHGVVLSGTRFVGFAVLIYPLLRVWTGRNGRARVKRDALLAGAAGGLGLAGLMGFLVYCQVQFGRWDLYFMSARTGWLSERLRWYTGDGLWDRPGFWDLFRVGLSSKQPNDIGRFFTWALLIVAAVGLWRLVRRRDVEGMSVPLLAAGLVLLGVTFLGRVEVGLLAMLRYLVPVMFLVVGGISAAPPGSLTLFPAGRRWHAWAAWILVTWMMALQSALLWRYMSNKFVA